ncbi:HNH endonuclease family protein [Adhaeribacter soli]|uniref:HNH endonuclease n=1 Tax=Adhaeribacter soli TaxID=2607655 RepID=A0A5N1J1S8_9BACT|nr:HNH endonuclease [Adhaeribacter soli]KAA9340539.1 HNH endonuclease [Adhaeribacter soli]
MKEADNKICELCRREVESLSRHHLVPREEGGKYGPTAELCQPCHSTIHLLIGNRELAREYNSISALQTAEPLQKYLRWVRNKRVARISNRRGRR